MLQDFTIVERVKGICIDAAGTTTLKEGQLYGLLASGSSHFYVFKQPDGTLFNHFGCYQSARFQVIENDWPAEPDKTIPDLDRDKVYAADLVWRTRGYKETELKQYFLRPRKTHAFFYHDKEMTRLKGCYPLWWFDGFVELEFFEDKKPVVVVMEPEELPKNEWQQLSMFDLEI